MNFAELGYKSVILAKLGSTHAYEVFVLEIINGL